MDNYTNETKDWLDQRFRKTDRDGIYFAHQPIYGFRRGHSEPGIIVRYIITRQIMKALAHLKFNSLLDVGGAEGYKAALARSIFNVDVRSADLSGEACRRAKEIYDIDGESIDIHKLHYHDNEFDVVLCSETLEHVVDINEATMELIRICSKAVVITVPHEPKHKIERNIRENVPHAHLHSLDLSSFNFVLQVAQSVISRRMLNPLIVLICKLADAVRKEKSEKHSQFVLSAFNLLVPVFRLVFTERVIRRLIEMDDWISNLIPSYSGMIFVILKDEKCYSERPLRDISTSQITNFKVPYHYLVS